MSLTEIASASLPRLPIQERKNRALKVKGKLREAIDLIVFEGADLQTASSKSGLTSYTLRQAFARPHVIAHLKARREVLRESLCGSNILRLGQIRDAANNMPAIQAIRDLEGIGERQHSAASGASASVGLTIRIINQSASQPMIDVTPNDLTHD
jgi:hypothetical protein